VWSGAVWLRPFSNTHAEFENEDQNDCEFHELHLQSADLTNQGAIQDLARLQLAIYEWLPLVEPELLGGRLFGQLGNVEVEAFRRLAVLR
jgi:hypothetical protein